MSQPTVSEVHVDRPMTNFSVRYMNNAVDFVADKAFPLVQVPNRSDVYYEFTPSYWFSDEMEPRAPGDAYPESGYVVTNSTFLCNTFAISKLIPDEVRANADSPLSPDREAAEWLAQKALINRERAFAAGFMATSVWTTDNTTATDWDASGGVPITNIQVAKRTIKNASGATANTLVMGKIVHDGLLTNAQITALVQYSQRAFPTDLRGILAAALDVETVLVGDTVYESADEGETSSLLPILDDDALLIHVPASPSLYTAAAGMTFIWQGGGGMGMVERFRIDDRKSDKAAIQSSYDQKKVAAALGYFFSDVV